MSGVAPRGSTNVRSGRVDHEHEQHRRRRRTTGPRRRRPSAAASQTSSRARGRRRRSRRPRAASLLARRLPAFGVESALAGADARPGRPARALDPQRGGELARGAARARARGCAPASGCRTRSPRATGPSRSSSRARCRGPSDGDVAIVEAHLDAGVARCWRAARRDRPSGSCASRARRAGSRTIDVTRSTWPRPPGGAVGHPITVWCRVGSRDEPWVRLPVSRLDVRGANAWTFEVGTQQVVRRRRTDRRHRRGRRHRHHVPRGDGRRRQPAIGARGSAPSRAARSRTASKPRPAAGGAPPTARLAISGIQVEAAIYDTARRAEHQERDGALPRGVGQAQRRLHRVDDHAPRRHHVPRRHARSPPTR